MKLVSMKQILGPLGVGALLLAAPAQAAVVVSATSAETTINDGAVIDGVAPGEVAPSDFNANFAVSSDTTTFRGMEFSFGSIALSEIPVEGGNFVLYYDAQETGGNPEVSITDLVLTVGSTTIFDYDDGAFGNIELDGTTATPLGNGGDISLTIPLALFEGLNLSGSDVLTLFWKQENDDNGADEWTTLGSGAFGPNDPIVSAVPLPASVFFMLGAFGGLALLDRRRRTATVA